MSERDRDGIEAALDVLRAARAPEGMEGRVLAAMRARENERSASGLVWVWGGVAASVAVMVWMLAGGMRHEVREERRAAVERMDDGVRSSPKTDPGGQARTGKSLDSATDGGTVRCFGRDDGILCGGRDDDSGVSEQPVRAVRRGLMVRRVAVREAGAVSFPAPPMPLTEQERLLLRVARKGDPEELALLNPVSRAARDVAEKAEVEKFFDEETDAANNGGSE